MGVCAVLLLVLSVVLVPLLISAGGYSVAAAVGLGLLTLGVCVGAVGQAGDAGWLFQYDLTRRFRAVCQERGLTTKNEAGELVYARMSRLMGNGQAWTATIRPLLGQSVADWERAGAAFALAYAVAGVRFSDNGDGTITMRAGYRSLESREFVINQADPDDSDDSVSWRERLATVVIGTTEGGQGFAVPLLDSHILIAGMTGSGKGSVIWSLILGLVPAFRGGVVRFWALDPKRMEMAIGRGFFGDRYATTDDAMVTLLERAAAEMLERADSLGGKVRKFEPSGIHPVNVIIVDELGYLSALLPDRKLRDRAEKALAALLVLGRAAGFVVVGALQDPRKETLSYRDLFPTRIAMKLDKPMVDLVLGTGMYEAGALCDQIPPPKAGGAGVAFVKSEGSGIPVCVRMTWCPDDLIATTAAQLAPLATTPRLAA
jgi:S-DNA-T family DNA segregation ATPase FtsK/SpoIIIE